MGITVYRKPRPLDIQYEDGSVAYTLLFRPEVDAAEYFEALDSMQDVAKKAAKFRSTIGKLDNAGPDALDNLPEMDELRTINSDLDKAMRQFVASFLVDESAPVFEQERPPLRAVTQIVEWVKEQYGGRPTGSSTGSPAPSTSSGKRSTGNSRSKA